MATHKEDPSGPNRAHALLIDEATLIHFAPRGGRKNLQGEDLTESEMVVSFAAVMDRFEGKLNKLGGLYKKERRVRLWLEFTEQLELPRLASSGDDRKRATDQLGTFPAAASNGHDNGKARDVVAAGEPASINDEKKKRAKTRT